MLQEQGKIGLLVEGEDYGNLSYLEPSPLPFILTTRVTSLAMPITPLNTNKHLTLKQHKIQCRFSAK
jgi:hypothetical protein